ncbi:MAG: multidrug effflux MFS transporter [Gemella sp.]|nr:multidrug effflux MFS transporter [Gemella sp.]
MTKTNNSKLFLVLFLGTLSAFGPFVTDLYLPALPYMTEYFGTSASVVQLTLTTSMMGLALGQLVVGPISDKYGRKKPLLVSLIIYLISTVLMIIVPNIYAMIFLRLIQGLSSAGAVVISRAVATDSYEGNELRSFFGLLMAVNGLAPIISPVFGALLLQFVSWKGVFVTLAIIGIILLIVLQKFNESLVEEKRVKGSLLEAYSNIFLIFKNKLFMALVFIQSFAFGTMFGYISSSPFILQTGYGVSSFVYSLIFAANGFGIMIGAKISSYLSNKKAILTALSGLLLSSLFIAITLYIKANVLVVEIFYFTLMISMGIMFPAISAAAMAVERRYSGTASAILGFFPFLFAGIVSPLVGMGDVFISTGLTLVGASAIAIIIFQIIKKKIN